MLFWTARPRDAESGGTVAKLKLQSYTPAGCQVAFVTHTSLQYSWVWAVTVMQVTDLAACEFEPGSASRVMLGREGRGMLVYDLEAQKPAAKVHISLQQILGLVKCHSMGSKHFPQLAP